MTVQTLCRPFFAILCLSTALLIVLELLTSIVHLPIPDSHADDKEETFMRESNYSGNIEDMSSSLTTIFKETDKLSAELVDEVKRSNVSVLTNTYLLYEEINEQLSSNTIKFLQLSYFSTVWNLSIVEPWIDADTTYLSSLPAVDQKKALPFFDLYIKKEVEDRLTECFHSNLPPQNQNSFHFHNLNEALIYSPRDVLIVRYMMSRWSKTKQMDECSAISGKKIEATERRLNFFVQNVKDKAQEIHGANFTFKVWKTICITSIPGIPFSFKNATMFIKRQLSLKKEETGVGATVVIPFWRMLYSIIKHNRNGFGYYYDPNYKFNGSNCKENALPYSSTVQTAADRMLKSLQLTEHFIGVYVRTERVSRIDQYQRGFINECLTKFYDVLESVEKKYLIPRSRVMLVHDAGKYGSNSFDYTHVQGKSKMILSKLQSSKIQIAHYEPDKFLDLPQHRVFVAAVEQEFLSRSYVLVTIGSGSFQKNIAERFKTSQSVDRLHEVCNTEFTLTLDVQQ